MEKVYKSIAKKRGQETADNVRKWVDRISKGAALAWKWLKALHENSLDDTIEMIHDKGAELLDIAIDAIIDWIVTKIIEKVSAKIISMLDPTGIMAVVNSLIAFYNAVETAIEKAREILEFVDGVLDNISEVMSGALEKGAQKLEDNLEKAIPLFLEFLANQLLSGKLGKKIKEMAKKAEDWIDEKIDWLVDKALAAGDWLIATGKEAISKIKGWLGMKKPFTSEAGNNHLMYFKKVGIQGKLILESDPMNVSVFLTKRKGEIPSDNTLDATKKTDHLAKVVQAEKLVSDIEALTYPKDKKAPQDDKIELDILSKSEALIELLKVLDPKGAAGLIPAPTFFPGFNGNKAQFMEVKYLSGYSDPKDSTLPKPNYQEGEEASGYKGTLQGALPALEDLGVRAKWVAFHIVNDNYGGKATDSNLVPAPQEINKNYLNEFEVELKKYLKSKETIWMKFNCRYRGTTPFLESLNATGGAMKYENNQWLEDPAKKLQFSTKVDPPIFSVVHINSLKKDPILWYFYTSETGMDTKLLDFLADEVAKGVKFNSVPEIQAAVIKFFKPTDKTLENKIAKTKFSF